MSNKERLLGFLNGREKPLILRVCVFLGIGVLAVIRLEVGALALGIAFGLLMRRTVESENRANAEFEVLEQIDSLETELSRTKALLELEAQEAERIQRDLTEYREPVLESIDDLIRCMEALQAGDLTIKPNDARVRDLEGLVTAFSRVVSDVRGVMVKFKEAATTVSITGSEIFMTSQVLAGAAAETTSQVETVSAASNNARTRIHSAANAAEHLSLSIEHINEQLKQARTISDDAVKQASSTRSLMEDLQSSTQAIDEVVKLISGIASQTNLLALNATIEAARAQEAGKGFAVVANEVKQLAHETAKATKEIEEKIRSVQEQTAQAVHGIERITDVISVIKEISDRISTEVEDQANAPKEIARNVREAAELAEEVAAHLANVSSTAAGTAIGAADSIKASEQITDIAATLEEVIHRYRL